MLLNPYRFGAVATPAQSILNSLLNWWDFEVDSGSVFASAIGAAGLDHSSSSIGVATGKVGNAMNNPGSFYVSVDNANMAPYQLGANSFTLFLWHRRDSANNPSEGAVAYLMGRWRTTGNARCYTCRVIGGATTDSYQFGVSTNGIDFNGVLGPVYESGVADWDFLVCGYDKDAASIFISVNGGTKTEAAHSGAIYTGGTARLALGASVNADASAAGYARGLYDSAGICTKALTDAEIAVLYNSGAGLNYAQLQALAA